MYLLGLYENMEITASIRINFISMVLNYNAIKRTNPPPRYLQEIQTVTI